MYLKHLQVIQVVGVKFQLVLAREVEEFVDVIPLSVLRLQGVLEGDLLLVQSVVVNRSVVLGGLAAELSTQGHPSNNLVAYQEQRINGAFCMFCGGGGSFF